MSGRRSLRINVETCTREEYLAFLEDLVNELAEHWTLGPDDGQTFPVLPFYGSLWIDIELRTNTSYIILRVARGNLYVKGFQTREGNLFELAKNEKELEFGGSKPLGFGCDYRDFLKAAGRPSVGRITGLLEGVSLGLDTLRDAVNSLANFNNPEEQQVTAGNSLLVMVWMISEAARFRHVAETVATRSEVTVDTFMAKLVMLWGELSRRVLQAFEYPQLFGLNVPDLELRDLGISTVAQLLTIIRIVSYSLPRFLKEDTKGKPPRRPKREAASSSYYTMGATPQREATLFYYTVGATLAEVFYVTIDDIDGENPGELYGTITVTDGYGSQDLFNRDREDYQTVYPGNNALLTGPVKPISANDYFTIDFQLKDKDIISYDDEVVNDQICWNPYHDGNVWNQSIKKVVTGRYGQATVCYGVFENAVVASVEVKVVNADDEDPADVYGWVKAAKNLEELPLFSKEKRERVQVKKGELIPLTRTKLVVQLNDALKISADLYDYDYLSRDDNFAHGSAIFAPKTQGSEKNNIDGSYGQVEVQVTWNMF